MLAILRGASRPSAGVNPPIAEGLASLEVD